MKSKERLLKEVQDSLIQDKSLVLQKANLVLGEGSLKAKVIFIGEAPGLEEDKEKRPFVGRSGKILRSNIKEIGLKENDFYITNLIKRRPENNRDPKIEEVQTYFPYLKKEIDIINPKVIVPLGRFSASCFVPDIKISRDQGKLFQFNSCFIIPIIHPAATFRSNQNKRDFIKSFEILKNFLKK